MGSASKLTGSVSRGLATLAFDDEYSKERREFQSRKARTVAEGFESGLSSAFDGVVDGVAGIFSKPIEGARSRGVKGFFKGVGQGIAGAFAKPASGIVQSVSKITEGVSEHAGRRLKKGPQRARLPRAIMSQKISGRVVGPFDTKMAKTQDLLRQAQKGFFEKEGLLQVLTTKHGRMFVTTNYLILISRAAWAEAMESEDFYSLRPAASIALRRIHRLQRDNLRLVFHGEGAEGHIQFSAEFSTPEHVEAAAEELFAHLPPYTVETEGPSI